MINPSHRDQRESRQPSNATWLISPVGTKWTMLKDGKYEVDHDDQTKRNRPRRMAESAEKETTKCILYDNLILDHLLILMEIVCFIWSSKGTALARV